MSYERETIDVRVSQRILWVGSEAYPLHNIARARTLKLVLKPGPEVSKFIKLVVLWMVLGFVASFIVGSGFATLVMLALIAFSTVNLIRTLSMPPLYALVIETAGTAHRAVISTDENLMIDLVNRIMHAINNPQAEFQMQVEHLHMGDKIQQFGDQNTGKVSQ